MSNQFFLTKKNVWYDEKPLHEHWDGSTLWKDEVEIE